MNNLTILIYLVAGNLLYAYRNPAQVANNINKIPSIVIFVSKNINPRTVMGTLLSEPTMAYVVADVAAVHHNDAKFK